MESHKNIEWVISRGLVPYNESIELMENILSRVIEGQNDHIILTEHPKIITAGTSADIADIMDGLDIEIIETKRGGKHTFHGPGQRVIYPIINIDKSPWDRDIKKYLNFLHEWVINTLSYFKISAHQRKDHIGIWVNEAGIDSKIAAIGIRARKWVAYHGIAVNISTDLDNFNSFVPCGIKELGVTSMEKLGVKITLEEFDEILTKEYYNAINYLSD